MKKNGHPNRLTAAVRLVIALILVGTCLYVSAEPVFAEPVRQTAQKKKNAPAAKKKNAPAAKKKNAPAAKKANPTPARGSSEVRKEKQRTEQEIADTKRQISDNERKIRSQLDRLNNLDSQIERQEATIDELNATIDMLALRVDILNDSITAIQRSDSLLCVSIAEGMRRSHVQRSRITPLAFVTGASSVAGARQRLNFLNMMQSAQQRRIGQLRRQRRQLENVRAELDSVMSTHSAALKQLATAKNILASRRAESQSVVNNLRNRGESLNRILADKQRRIKQLDAELNRIIAEEARRASGGRGGKANGSNAGKGRQGVAEADRKLTGSFAANKGKLLFPVAGRYTVVGTFGRSKHDRLSHVQVDNSGIDISVAAGTKARAVFEGTVSSIFFMDGYENIVIIRHGEYLTVYAGLASISVKKGDKVKTGQNIGTVATVDGTTVLHFEVRKERAKLNPLQWIK